MSLFGDVSLASLGAAARAGGSACTWQCDKPKMVKGASNGMKERPSSVEDGASKTEKSGSREMVCPFSHCSFMCLTQLPPPQGQRL